MNLPPRPSSLVIVPEAHPQGASLPDPLGAGDIGSPATDVVATEVRTTRVRSSPRRWHAHRRHDSGRKGVMLTSLVTQANSSG